VSPAQDALLVVTPVIAPLVAAVFALVAALSRRTATAEALGVVGAGAAAAASFGLAVRVVSAGPQAAAIGGWPAPFGIVLVADHAAVLMLCAVCTAGLAIFTFARGEVSERHAERGQHGLMLLLLAGACGSLLTSDLFNLFVWYEVMLVSALVLVGMSGGRRPIEGSLKYLTINLLASTAFLTAVGGIYGVAGTLSLAELSGPVGEAAASPALTSFAVLLATALAVKAGIFPLFFWLPAAYPVTTPIVTALLGGILTKVAMAALLRVAAVLLWPMWQGTQPLVAALAGLTMFVGVMGAIAQSDMRRLLAFHVISQIGYAAMGLAIATPLAVAGALLFLAHNIVAKTALLLSAGAVRRVTGTESLERLGGLAASQPALAAGFSISALALAGMPPLSGFWAKLALIRAGLEAEARLLTATAACVSLLTLFSMLKIWDAAFWRPAGQPAAAGLAAGAAAGAAEAGGAAKETAGVEAPEASGSGMGPLQALGRRHVMSIAGLALVAIGIGLAIDPIWALADAGARGLIDPAAYRDAALRAASFWSVEGGS